MMYYNFFHHIHEKYSASTYLWPLFLCSQKTSIHVNSFLKVNLSLCLNLCGLSNWQLSPVSVTKRDQEYFHFPMDGS